MLLSLFWPISFANRIPYEWVSTSASPNSDYFHTHKYMESYVITQAAHNAVRDLVFAHFRLLTTTTTGRVAGRNPLLGHDAWETAEIQTRMKDLSDLWMQISMAVKKWQPYTTTAVILDVKHTSL